MSRALQLDSAEIYLNHGRFITFVDYEDVDWLNRWCWHKTTNGYVARTYKDRLGKRSRLFMHNEILNSRGVDHIDRDRLNNTRENLRIASTSLQMFNRGRTGSLQYPRGVSKNNNRFSAVINVNKIVHYLGTFDTPEEAGKAYQKAAMRYHGEYPPD